MAADEGLTVNVWHGLIGLAALAAITGLIALVNSPARGESITLIDPTPSVSPSATPSSTPAPGFPVNVNAAGLDDLQTLPGIGPERAQAIIDYRETHGPFSLIEQVQNVEGIGPALFENLKDLITID